MKVAVVGATGLVGTRMLEVLAERRFPVTELLPVASERSVGREVPFAGRPWRVVGADEAVSARPSLALFSAGGKVSRVLAPRFAETGCRVVDNSSYWRMDPGKKLVVPEINGDVLEQDDRIIANLLIRQRPARRLQRIILAKVGYNILAVRVRECKHLAILITAVDRVVTFTGGDCHAFSRIDDVIRL